MSPFATKNKKDNTVIFVKKINIIIDLYIKIIAGIEEPKANYRYDVFNSFCQSYLVPCGV